MDYGMFTPEGNKRVETLLNSLTTKARRGAVARGNVTLFVRGGMERIEKKHGEVFDTVVRESIVYQLNKLCEEMLWEHLDYDDL